ncbi:MAG: hypothetical protein PHF05_08895 [Candidatus Izemoplasmatales bacterium]|nr:hypothetical protein [Candidatus Izemoplasmatales bacterium]MDY0138612.1 hypothetical protein [Candidatus Izemoplasmatales bacterium]
MLKLELLKKENVERFNQEQEKAFSIHERFFEEGQILEPEDPNEFDFDAAKILGDKNSTILEIYDGTKYIGGTIVSRIDKSKYDIVLFYLTIDSLGKGLGKNALSLVESYFLDAELFRLITPSAVLYNTVFYVNKCGYKIVEIVGFNKDKNIADFVFEKEINRNK